MSNEPPEKPEDKPGEPSSNVLVEVVLDENSIARCTPDIEHERNVAIYDLLESNFLSSRKRAPAALTACNDIPQ